MRFLISSGIRGGNSKSTKHKSTERTGDFGAMVVQAQRIYHIAGCSQYHDTFGYARNFTSQGERRSTETKSWFVSK